MVRTSNERRTNMSGPTGEHWITDDVKEREKRAGRAKPTCWYCGTTENVTIGKDGTPACSRHLGYVNRKKSRE